MKKILWESEAVPYMVRRFIGDDYRFVIPASCLCGAALLLVSDIAARLMLKPHVGLKTTAKDFAKVSNTLQQLGLGDMTMRNINQLSGGELQKVSIARAFVQEPRIFLLDEPTSNLDLKNQMDILHTIRRIVTENSLAAVITMHNLNLAFRFADYILLLNKGHIVAQGSIDSITHEILSEVYGVQVEMIRHKGHVAIIPV